MSSQHGPGDTDFIRSPWGLALLLLGGIVGYIFVTLPFDYFTEAAGGIIAMFGFLGFGGGIAIAGILIERRER